MKDYMKIIEDSRDEMIQTLSDFVAFPSVAVEEEGTDTPFGIEVQKAYEFIMKKAEEDGFVTKNVDNYGGHIDFPGKTDEIVAIVGHVDVVPAGDLSNWNTDPYKAEVIDGKIFGRGTIDDKGPLVCGYYAMKALRDAGFEPDKTIRVILGLDEETNWYGMKYYMEREKAPVAGFSPDADYPAIHAEKGIWEFPISRKIDNSKAGGLQLISLTGGTVVNAVADGATAKIALADKKDEFVKLVSDYMNAHPDYKITLEDTETLALVSVKGVSGHASTPEVGVNAISILCDLLSGVEFENSDVNDVFKFYKETIGFDMHGERIGAAYEDEASGKLSLNVGIASINEAEAVFTLDIRHPCTCLMSDIRATMKEVINKYGFDFGPEEDEAYEGPIYKAIDDPIIVALMEVYKKHTGDVDAKPLVIGGGTYARAVPNTVAFGPLMPGAPELAHMPNEYIEIEDMIRSTKIYAEAVYELAK